MFITFFILLPTYFEPRIYGCLTPETSLFRFWFTKMRSWNIRDCWSYSSLLICSLRFWLGFWW